MALDPRIVALTAGVALLIGCAGDDSPTSPTPGTTSPPGTASPTASPAPGTVAPPGTASPTASPSPMTLLIKVSGRTVTPPPRDVPVDRGALVRLVITSATANRIHVHGVELERDLPAGRPVALDLSFTEPGSYDVETHRPELRLLRFVVR